MASVRSTETRRDKQEVANEPSKRRRTVDLALISLVTDLTHEQCNALLPVHPNIHGIIMVAEKTCECCVYGAKEISNNLPLSPKNIPTKGFLPPRTCWFARRLFSLSHPCVRQPLVAVGVDVRART